MNKKKIVILVVLGIFVLLAVVFVVNMCGAKGCSALSVKKGEFCKKHSCELNYWMEEGELEFEWDGHCYNYKNPEDNFCDEHICDLYDEDAGNCEYIVKYYKSGNSFGTCCEKHGCYFCGNDLVKGTKCCKEHKCVISDCKKMVANASDAEYCYDHTCIADSCYNKALKVKSYCKEHTNCTITDCNNPREKYAEYCSAHKCSTTLCKNAKEKGESKCSECLRKDGQNNRESAYKDKLIVDADGKQLWKVYIKDTFKIDANYTGNGNFIIWLLDGNQEPYELLCNEIGTYKLSTSRVVPDGWYYIQVEWNGGSWNANWWGTYGK